MRPEAVDDGVADDGTVSIKYHLFSIGRIREKLH